MGYGLASKQIVNLLGGSAQAKAVVPGQAMWTLDGDRTTQTTVSAVTAVKGREAVEVVTDHTTFLASPDLLLPARLEPVTRPSGYLRRDLAGFRVRVVSSYLSDALRHYVGGDAHHMRQRFPRVVLRDIDTFNGFLDVTSTVTGTPANTATAV
jgi:hypothetical protein